MKSNIARVTLAIFSFAALLAGLAPAAQAAGCSLASLKGSYALDRQGTLVESILGLPAPAPWAEVAFEDFDGAGTFVGRATVNVGGAVVTGTVTGTYTVSSDCTGSKTVDTSVGVTVHEAIIITGEGQRMIGTQTDPLGCRADQGTEDRRLSVQLQAEADRLNPASRNSELAGIIILKAKCGPCRATLIPVRVAQ